MYYDKKDVMRITKCGINKARQLIKEFGGEEINNKLLISADVFHTSFDALFNPKFKVRNDLNSVPNPF